MYQSTGIFCVILPVLDRRDLTLLCLTHLRARRLTPSWREKLSQHRLCTRQSLENRDQTEDLVELHL